MTTKKITKEKKVRLVLCIPADTAKKLKVIANKNCIGNMSYLCSSIFDEWLNREVH